MSDDLVVNDPTIGVHPSGGRVLVKKAEKAKTNINSIMEKYFQTGYVPMNGEAAQFGDFSSGVDFHTAMNQVAQVNQEFLRFPLAVRKRCENDPGQLLDMLLDPEARAELVELGVPEAMLPEAASQGVPEPVAESSEPVAESPQEPDSPA